MTEYTPEKVAELAERTKRMREWQEMETDDFLASDLEAVLTAAEDLTAVSAERDAAVVKLPDCDGGCDYNSGPEETCSAHGRPVAEVWQIVQDIAAERGAIHARITEHQADRDRLHKAITEARKLNDRAQRDPDIWEDMDRILRAALDKEGEGDD